LYKAKRLGLDSGQFAEMKAALVDAQNITLMERRDEACGSLREHRDEEYEYLLFKQQEQRDALKTRQRQGVRSTNLLDRMYDPDYILLRDRDQDREDKAEARPLQVGAAHAHAAFESPANETFKMRDGFSAMGGLGLGALGAIAEIGERLFDSFFGGVPAPKIEKPTPPPAELQQPEAKLARATDAQVRAAESQATEAEQLEDYWQERRQRRRERD